jgi:2-oxoisovalerate dehydrogenase E1 component
MLMTKTQPNSKLALLEQMFLSREADRREGILARQGKGWFQISASGHEALAAIMQQLGADDYTFPHYRDRALVMARGVSVYDMALIFFGKRGSTSGGRQLPGHFSDRKLNIWSLASPTGSNLLPACGVAWGMQLDGKNSVAVASVGDSGMRQGEFFEAVSFAIEKNLPVVFLVEDNGYGISTPTFDSNPLRKGLFSDKYLVKFDARKVSEVQRVSSLAIQRARNGEGPTVLWGELDRMTSHSSSDDHRIYRPAADLQEMTERDPLAQYTNELIANDELDAAQWEARKAELEDYVDREYARAEASENPSPEETYAHLTGELNSGYREEKIYESGGKPWRMLDAVNHTFSHGLSEADNKYVFFGEDICDPLGGVFKITNGLSAKFPERVFNSPLAELTIVGVACGLASYGYKPVFEIQFIDFVGPAWNQLVNNLATLRWRSFGEWKAPAVIYAPCGAYLPAGGPWHSQSNEGTFAHVPGLRVVVPSTPEDAAGLMHTAMREDDPVVFLLPKHLLRAKREIPAEVRSVPLGKAKVLQSGADISVVAWGNCIEKVQQAAGELGDAVSVEIIDLRTIQPWDRETVTASVTKTGRLLVVQEDNRSCSAGQMILSELAANGEVWDKLKAAPQLISREDIHIGYNPIYEKTCLPSAEQIKDTIRTLTAKR